LPLTLTPVRLEERPILDNLLQLYLHEMSRFDDRELDDSGRYAYPHLDRYFTEDSRFPYLIRVKGKLAGFVLVRDVPSVTNERIHTVAEFFIIEVYRRLGIGEEIARLVFDRLPGTWQVAQKEENAIGKAFWKQVIWRYTAKQFREFRTPDWHGPIFEFVSPGPRPEAVGESTEETVSEATAKQTRDARQFS